MRKSGGTLAPTLIDQGRAQRLVMAVPHRAAPIQCGQTDLPSINKCLRVWDAENLVLFLALSCLLLGTWLGARFQVLVLGPILTLGVTGVTLAGMVSGSGSWLIAGAAALGSASIQLGYLGGALWQVKELLRPRKIQGLHQ